MSIPIIIGPISTGSSFTLGSISDNEPAILNASTGSTGNSVTYYWESDLTKITNVPVFTANGTGPDNVTFIDTTYGGGIGFTGTAVINVGQPTEFSMVQTTYSQWWPPNIFLSMAEYSIIINNQIAEIYTKPDSNDSIKANNIIMIPVLLYSSCNNNGSYNVINTPSDSITNWYCNITTEVGSGCSGIEIIASGWTNLSDCVAGDNYVYCATGQSCGNENCNGPCTTQYEDCDLRSGSYICQFNPEKYISTTQWWTSPIFIGGIIAIIIIIAILIFVIFVVKRKEKQMNKSPANYESFSIYG